MTTLTVILVKISTIINLGSDNHCPAMRAFNIFLNVLPLR